MTRFRDHLLGVADQYRASIEEGRFEEVDDALYNRRWMAAEGVPPVTVTITEQTQHLFDDLSAAVAARDRVEALMTLQRIRDFLHTLDV